MISSQTRLIQETFAFMYINAEPLAHIFYERLFAHDPQLRTMFPHDMQTQEHKFFYMLALIVDSMEDEAALVPLVHALGRRHQTYGIHAAQYTLVSETLFATFAEALGDQWTAEVDAAWHTLYNHLAEIMQSRDSRSKAN